MIKLSGNFVLTQQVLAGTVVQSSVIMDTLWVTNVTMDFTVGSMSALIQRGTLNTAATFVLNYPPVYINVNPDGSFVSTDGSWKGSLGKTLPALMAQLKSQFDQSILASGLVTGTAE